MILDMLPLKLKIRLLMSENFYFELGDYATEVEDISSEVFMTSPSFCRFFKKSTHKTFTAFLNEYRINHATKLLSETDLDVKSICYKSGFNNLSNFFRNFRKTTNFTPNAYRKSLFEDAID